MQVRRRLHSGAWARWPTLCMMVVVPALTTCGAKTGLDTGSREGGDAGVSCTPSAEQCNDRDDDCDGVVDDGIACFFLDGRPIAPVPAAMCGGEWYRYDYPDSESANPVPDIRRSGEVVLAIQYAASCAGAYVGVIADLPADGSGGQLVAAFKIAPKGGAGVEVSDEPSECSFDPAVGIGMCNWVWQPCCTDGVLLGPFSSDSCLDLRLEAAVGVSQLVILDGADVEIPRPFPAKLQICTRIRPAHDG